jgi:hypothetical protein
MKGHVVILLMILFCRKAVADEPPVAGRPVDFSGAIGSFKLSTCAKPTSVVSEEPVLYTVRISGHGNLTEIPRPQLDSLNGWHLLFQIAPAGDRYLEQEQAREFDYYLRPRNANVKQIPALALVYYRTGILPPEKGYQTAYAPAILLRVRPSSAPAEGQTQEQSIIRNAPPSVRTFPELSELLSEPDAELSLWWIVMGLLLPPMLIACWHLRRNGRHPKTDSGPIFHRKKAAARALRRLQSLSTVQAALAGEIVSEFLRGHSKALPVEPTATDIQEHLKIVGAGQTTINVVSQFFEGCAADRFSPTEITREDWKSRAVEIIQHLEQDLCLASQ